jgi:hypothetical protein
MMSAIANRMIKKDNATAITAAATLNSSRRRRNAMPQERHRRQRLSEQLRNRVENEHVD